MQLRARGLGGVALELRFLLVWLAIYTRDGSLALIRRRLDVLPGPLGLSRLIATGDKLFKFANPAWTAIRVFGAGDATTAAADMKDWDPREA